MNVNKKLGRFKQWAGERMGAEVKTNASDDFKSLEAEMGLRQEGMERLQKSMNTYIKTLSKRNEGDDKEKALPVAYLGSTMVNHGEAFEDNSDFGQCLQSMGRTNERIGRIQETYVAEATTSWLESLERSTVQMKEYQVARKKLEQRRLNYDTSLAKVGKVKKEDFKVEEELRVQKAKYEETSEEVYRRMQDIREAEADSVADLGAFLEAELKYYDRCREILMQLKRDWPASGRNDSGNVDTYRDTRSRSATTRTYADRYSDEDSPPLPGSRPIIKSTRAASGQSPVDPIRKASGGYEQPAPRLGAQRSATFQGSMNCQRETSPIEAQRIARVPSDNVTVKDQRAQLRPLTRGRQEHDGVNDHSDESAMYSSPDRSFKERSASPATSYGSAPSRNASYSGLESMGNAKKAPPPPPPSRAKKPPPPPPPMKRSALSNTTMSYA